jgi:hypothetical protein
MCRRTKLLWLIDDTDTHAIDQTLRRKAFSRLQIDRLYQASRILPTVICTQILHPT